MKLSYLSTKTPFTLRWLYLEEHWGIKQKSVFLYWDQNHREQWTPKKNSKWNFYSMQCLQHLSQLNTRTEISISLGVRTYLSLWFTRDEKKNSVNLFLISSFFSMTHANYLHICLDDDIFSYYWKFSNSCHASHCKINVKAHMSGLHG